MMPAFGLSGLLILLLSVDNAPLDRPLPVPGTDGLMQYDDGTACWVTWSGLYRGTWFDINDWVPGQTGTEIFESEYWFFHDSSHPWDTSSFYSEVYTGDASGPGTQLDQTSVLAVHYAPCGVEYDYFQYSDTNFWVLVDAEMSPGGWPSTLGDNSPNFTGTAHSFWSDDFVTWNPWSPQGGTTCDFFIRTDAWLVDLNAASWGSIKALFH